jgi:anthranilate phosphoribosyltransferase
MKHAIGPRKEMGVRTIFNVLGPLTNPAGAPNQLLGVFSDELVEPMVRVLQQLGSHHVMVVHSQDGMDEISIGAATHVAELKNGEIRDYVITPEEFGFIRADIGQLSVDGAEQSLDVIRGVFANQAGPARDIVILNAGAAIYVAGLAEDLSQGMEVAGDVIADGGAAAKLEQLVQVTQGFK